MGENDKVWDSGTLPLAATGKNRIYNALVKAENSSKSAENLFDISGHMIEREKDNSKKALEELWILKKTCQEKDIKVLDLLIDYYQKKVDSVRQKEERLRQISGESGKLIEDRKKLQHDLAGITQEIEDCTQEINFLKAKQEKLQTKERELKEKTDTLGNKIQDHEKEMLDSLHTVILLKPEEKNSAYPPSSAMITPMAAQKTTAPPIEPLEQTKPVLEASEVMAETKSSPAVPDSIYKTYKQAETSRFPKSIVKTDKGRILGEYHYDPKVYKNSRSYVFNGRYFVDQLRKGIELFRIDETNVNILNDFVLMVSDILNRVQSRPNIHFEVSTNEILNAASLSELMEGMKVRDLNMLENFCNRYTKKIEMLGQNHEMILAEQLANLSNTNTHAG